MDSSGNVDEVSSSLELWVLNDSREKEEVVIIQTTAFLILIRLDKKKPAEKSYEIDRNRIKITE